MKRCGQDMVQAQIWPDKEAPDLIQVLAQGRSGDIFEPAALLKELYGHHQLTPAQIARLLGKDKSWVSRRISFLTWLPDEILDAGSILARLIHQAPVVLYAGQGELEQSRLLSAFDKTWQLMITLEKTVRGATP